MVFPGKKGVVRSKTALILLCSVWFNKNCDYFFEDSLQKTPILQTPAVFHLTGCTLSAWVSKLQHVIFQLPIYPAPTVVKYPVNLADRYFCTESALSCLLTTINSGYSQKIWELWENMGKNLALLLTVLMFVVQSKMDIGIFLSSLEVDFFFFCLKYIGQ